MSSLFQGLLITHIAAGMVSLVLFWVPIFTKKGGRTHRQVGRWYVRAMWVVVSSAFVLSIENWVQGNIDLALFLGFIGALSARPLWLGIECLQSKRGVTTRYRRTHLLTSVLLSFSGVGLIFYGVFGAGNSVLMVAFGVLGLLSSFDVIKLLRYNSKEKYQAWLDDHVVNMCITGIASHTAFLIFGANSLLGPYSNSTMGIVLWVAPTVVGTLGMQVARHRFKTNPSKAASGSLTEHVNP